MKPNFAMSLSFDGLRLLHRAAGGWHLVGSVTLDDADLTGTLARLRQLAERLEPGGVSTKVLIPNDQIKYLALDNTRAEHDDVRDALLGATPYAVEDLVYDFAKGGGRTYVAAAAKETLSEAREFATEHGFNPVCFAAVPDPFTYVGEAYFGAVDGFDIEQDDEPVVVIGDADVGVAAPVGDAQNGSAPAPNPADAAMASADDATAVPQNVAGAARPSKDPENSISEPDTIEQDGQIKVGQADAPQDAPLKPASLRADRNDGRPAPASPPSSARVEPLFNHQPDATLAVPTGKGTDPMPPLSAPSRAARTAPAAVPVDPPNVSQAPQPAGAPPVTGDAATALSSAAVRAAASLTPMPEGTMASHDDATPDTSGKPGAAAAALGAATAVGGAVGGMFASRRMARAKVKSKTPQDSAASPAKETSGETSKMTVFGARKTLKRQEQVVIGGKPRFLGLILTIILLVVLLVIAAFATLTDTPVSSWLGIGAPETEVAAAQIANPAPTVVATAPVVVVAPIAIESPETPAPAVDVLAAPTPHTSGRVLTPDEAARVYAATGVWQRAPRIAHTTRTTTLDGMLRASAVRPVLRVHDIPLSPAISNAGDSLIATPVDPPPPSQTFDFNAQGLVVATPQGAITPDGFLVIAGRPPLSPPTRPGTVAPEITPQDQIAALIPQGAVPVLDAPEGVIVIAGRPVIVPPVRPGTVAPADPIIAPDADVDSLTADITAALSDTAAQTPDLNPRRPLARPASVLEAAALANAPAVGNLTVSEAAAFRPRARPAGLAPTIAPDPDDSADPTATTGLRIAPEIAAAVQAATDQPAPIVNATVVAVPRSARPDPRPRNIALIVERATAARQRTATQVAAVAPRTVTPSGPTGRSVARAATLDNAINLRAVNVIGIYGSSGDRRALVRLTNGRYQRVTVGDRLDGGRVTAISAQALNYTKQGRAITLQVPG